MEKYEGLALLTAMITPAVLISACGTLILSTSNRLARIVDRVRHISQALEQLYAQQSVQFEAERRRALDQQLSFYATRSRLIQSALTCNYVALGLFVGTTVSIGASGFIDFAGWLPTVLGVTGTLVLFAACVLLIAEARMALLSVRAEMSSTLELTELLRNEKRRESLS